MEFPSEIAQEEGRVFSDVGPISISVASYNLLSDCYVRVPGQIWNAFEHCTDDALNWGNRCPKLVENLLQSKADIICVQEMTYECRDGSWGLPAWTDAILRAGYTVVMQKYSQKDLAKNADRNLRMVGKQIPTGLATFYRCEKLLEVAESKHGSGSGISLFLALKGDSPNKVLIFISNIHLVGDPNKFDMHLKQLNPVIKNFELAEAQMQRTYPAARSLQIICGDFNGDICYSDEANVVSQWFLERSFSRAHTGASWAGGDRSVRRLDHVMYRACASGGDTLLVDEILCKPADDESNELVANDITALPTESHPSDHILVSAEFRLSFRESSLSL